MHVFNHQVAYYCLRYHAVCTFRSVVTVRMSTCSDSKDITCIEDRLNLLMTERSLIQNQFQLYARSTTGARTFLQKQVAGYGLIVEEG